MPCSHSVGDGQVSPANGYELDLSSLKRDFTLDYVLLQWGRLSRAIARYALIRSKDGTLDATLSAAARLLKHIGDIDEATFQEIERFVDLRYTLVEDIGKASQTLKKSDAERMLELAEEFERRIKTYEPTGAPNAGRQSRRPGN